MQRAHQHRAVGITQMHRSATAIAEKFAFGAFLPTHPFAVAVRMVTMLPHVHKIVLIDVSLMVIAADARTC